MSYHPPIVDVEFLHLLDPIDGAGWGVWACVATFEDDSSAEGSIQGDGISNWAAETYVSEAEAEE